MKVKIGFPYPFDKQITTLRKPKIVDSIDKPRVVQITSLSGCLLVYVVFHKNDTDAIEP